MEAGDAYLTARWSKRLGLNFFGWGRLTWACRANPAPGDELIALHLWSAGAQPWLREKQLSIAVFCRVCEHCWRTGDSLSFLPPFSPCAESSALQASLGSLIGRLYQVPWVTRTKRMLDGSDNRTLFFHHSGGQKPKIKVSARAMFSLKTLGNSPFFTSS